ncbi:hypothetical protein [Thermodesulfobacterium sp. TA1]|uniref:hypothetical protein n=1 Tax=Thermodesulfobacterium sp. TA1 TaxID=2234087 RepID=UPI001981E4B5|nr:hypothetical protein [Thermodesulfobacterium sp. TA1]
MNLAELVEIASSEEKAEEFLRAKGVLKTFTCCPFCGNKIWREEERDGSRR